MSLEGITTHLEWSTPRGKQELETLGLCTYYRQFIPSFADISKLLATITEEKQAFQRLLKVDDRLQSLKEVVCTAPLLGYPQPGEKFIVYMDMSNVKIRGVLSQMVAYYGKTLNKSQTNYLSPGGSCWSS
jgi:hypothetical protein